MTAGEVFAKLLKIPPSTLLQVESDFVLNTENVQTETDWDAYAVLYSKSAERAIIIVNEGDPKATVEYWLGQGYQEL